MSRRGFEWHSVFVGRAIVNGRRRRYAYRFCLTYRESLPGGRLTHPHVSAGCRMFTFAEARRHWKSGIYRDRLSPEESAIYDQRALRCVRRAELRWLKINAEYRLKAKKRRHK